MTKIIFKSGALSDSGFCMLMNNVLMTSMLLSAFKMAFSFFFNVALACLLCAAHDETSSKLKHFKKRLKTRNFNLWMILRGMEEIFDIKSRIHSRIAVFYSSLKNTKNLSKTLKFLNFLTRYRSFETPKNLSKLTVMGTSNFSSHVLSFRRNLKIVCVAFSLLDSST